MRALSIPPVRGLLWLGLVAGCAEPSPSASDAALGDASIASDAPILDASPTPALDWGPCPTRFRDECATIAMPLDHDDPSRGTIDVLVSRRGHGSRQLWLLQGGPGGSAETFYGWHDFLANVDPELEVFTIEHRGVGESTRLGCASAEAASSAQGVQIAPSEWAACQADVEAEWGDRLAFFDTTEAAHDLALAIELTRREGVPVFVYGGSYGTYWANRFGVLHPGVAAGLILDAPVMPGADLHLYDLAFETVGRRVFEELCVDAPRCREHLGDDPGAFLERVAVALEAGHCGALGVDFDTWRLVFAIFLMDYNLRNWLPALFYRLDRCSADDQAAIATLFGQLFGGGGGAGELPRTSRVLQTHICLSEFWPAGLADETELERARAQNLFFQDGIAHVYAAQSSWPRYDAGAVIEAYAPPSVPMLVMAGSLDPAAPPADVGYGYRDHLTGPAQHFVEIPYGAHTVLTAGGVVASDMPSCPVQLVRAFLRDPEGELPLACARAVLSPSFDAPAALLDRYWGTTDLYD